MCWALENILMLEGYKTHTATSGKEGLELIEQLHLILASLFLDVKLPDIDGLKFPRFAQHYPQIKIIIITGYYYRDSDAVQQGLAIISSTVL